MIDTVIWDWNGTLLDDVQACVDAENELLDARRLERIDKSYYLDIFDFPVINYYRKVGFTFETERFETVASEYHRLYVEKSNTCALHKGAENALAALSGAGFRQVILSASQTDILLAQIEPFNIRRYFEKVIGQDDLLAKGKIDTAKMWMKAHGINPRNVAVIGDTIHDFETASALDARCLLVPNGHQSRARLERCVCERCAIAESLEEAAAGLLPVV